MRTPDAALITAKNKLDSDDPWLLLVELTHDGWEILRYDTGAASFHEGETVTGGTSSASAEVYFVVELTATTGYLATGEITGGPFQDGEDLDGDHSTTPGSALVTTPLPTGEAVFRYTKNLEDVTYEGVVWEKFNFAMGSFVDSTNEMPSMSLSITNVDRIMEGYINKGAGFIEDQVRILFIYAGELAADPIIDEYYKIKSVLVTDEAVSFTLGIRNPLIDTFPSQLFSRKTCRFKLKDSNCGYAGGETTCNKTMTRCVALENEINYGGFPAIPGGFFDF